jgi:hypothetical protein
MSPKFKAQSVSRPYRIGVETGKLVILGIIFLIKRGNYVVQNLFYNIGQKNRQRKNE